MTIFILHAAADSDLAERLARTFERKGHFVELDDGRFEAPAPRPNDVTIAIWRQGAPAAWSQRLRRAGAHALALRTDRSEPPPGAHRLDVRNLAPAQACEAALAKAEAMLQNPVMAAQTGASPPKRAAADAIGAAALSFLLAALASAGAFSAAYFQILKPQLLYPAFVAGVTLALFALLFSLASMARRRR